MKKTYACLSIVLPPCLRSGLRSKDFLSISERGFNKYLVLLCSLCFFIQAARATGTPVLSLPVNNDSTYNLHPSLFWSAVGDADHYEVQVAADSAFSLIVASGTGLHITRFVSLAELPAGTLYWRVRAVDTLDAAGAWSSFFAIRILTYPAIYNVPDGANLTYIKMVMDTAVRHQPAIVRFAFNGFYALEPAGGDQFAIRLDTTNNLLIDGNGSTMVIKNSIQAGFMQLVACKHTSIKGFRVDWDPLPYTFVEVIKNNTNDTTKLNLNVRLKKVNGQTSAYYPELTNNNGFTDYYSQAFVMDKNIPGAMKKGLPVGFNIPPKYFTRIACTDPPEYSVFIASNYGKYFAEGDILALAARGGTGSLFSITRCVDMTFDSVINYACPNVCYLSAESSDLKVLNCQSALKDSTRYLSSAADGIHARANMVGPWIEHCSLIGIGDDAVPLYNKGVPVMQKFSSSSIKTVRTYMNLDSAGVFNLFIPKTGKIISTEFTVTSTPALNTGDNTYTINFSPALTPAQEDSLTDIGNPDLQQNVQVFNETERNELFMVHNNTFTNRGRGVIARSVNGQISANKIYNVSSGAIGLYNEPASWYNGLYSGNISILDNDIRDCAFDNNSTDIGVIDARFFRMRKTGPTTYLDTLSATLPHFNLTIKGNTIQNFSKHGITLFNARQSSVINNTFTSNTATFIQPGSHYAIFLNTTDGCLIKGNNLSGETRTLTGDILIQNSTNVTNIP